MFARIDVARWSRLCWGATIVAACVLILGGRPTVARKEPGGYVERVLAAARKGDGAALAKLAAAPGIDPWRVIDVLSVEKLGAMAPAYARGSAAPDADQLRAYAASLPAEVPAAREALREGLNFLRATKLDEAAKKLRGASFPKNSIGAVRTHTVLGGVLVDLEDRDGALAAYTAAADAAREIGWLSAEHGALVGRQWRLEEAARYADMRHVLQRRRQIQQRLGSEAALAEINRELGGVHVAVGTPRRALPSLALAADYYRRHKMPLDGAFTQIHLALAHAMRGEFARALSLTEEAADACRDLEDGAEGLDYALGVQLSILVDIGKTEPAVRLGRMLLDSGLERAPEDQVTIQNFHAAALAGEGRFDEALKQLGGSFAIAEGPDLKEARSATLLIRALAVHRERENYADGLADCRAAVELVPRSSQLAAYATWGMGTCAIQHGAGGDAEALLSRALLLAAEREDADLLAMTHASLADLYMRQGDHDAALEHAYKAAAEMDRSSVGLSDEEAIDLRSRRTLARAFRTGVRAAVQLGDADELYRAIESARARALLAALGGAQAARGLDLPLKLAEQEQELRAAVRERRERYSLLRSEHGKTADIRAAHHSLRDAERAYVDLAARIQREAGTARASMAYAATTPLAKVVKRTPADTALVLFAESEDEAVALVVRPSGAQIRSIAKWPELRAICAGCLSDDSSEAPAAIEKRHRRLAKGLIDSLALPAPVRTLHVSPDGVLTALPWHIIATYAARPVDVTLVPSGSALHAGTPAGPASTKRLVLGDPVYAVQVEGRRVPWWVRGRRLQRLRHSAEEARLIARSGDVLLLREEASESRLRTELGREQGWDVVHLGCHGLMDEATPSLSSLALTPTRDHDGFLTAVEIFQMRFRARLVVLAACDVGRGIHVAGEGVLGVVRAFFAAGAQATLVSLWPADDASTGRLMERFYAERAKPGVSDHEALRRAQVSVRDFRDNAGQRVWAHPYYWAGWVFWGVTR